MAGVDDACDGSVAAVADFKFDSSLLVVDAALLDTPSTDAKHMAAELPQEALLESVGIAEVSDNLVEGYDDIEMLKAVRETKVTDVFANFDLFVPAEKMPVGRQWKVHCLMDWRQGLHADYEGIVGLGHRPFFLLTPKSLMRRSDRLQFCMSSMKRTWKLFFKWPHTSASLGIVPPLSSAHLARQTNTLLTSLSEEACMPR